MRATRWRPAAAGALRERAMQADVERFLARLLTEPAFRERFLADPADVANQERLSPAEAQAVAAMPVQDLHTAARSYQHKRESKLRKRGRSWFADWFGSNRS